MLKRALCLLAPALVALSLSACGGGEASPTATPTATPDAPQAPAPTATPATSAPEPEPAGDSADATGGGVTISLGERSQALYRIDEQLAGRTLRNDAVGETEDLEGRIVFAEDGSVNPDLSSITVGVSSLTSDSERRDNYVRRRTLLTDTYPDVVLAVSAVDGLPWPLPASGVASFTISGDLTVRDQTRPTVWDVDAVFGDGKVTGSAKTTLTFEEYGIDKPSVAVVLSVADEIRLEIAFEADIAGE